MSSVDTIGAAQEVNLELHRGSALSFDGEWWTDEVPPTAINISAINVRINIGGVRYDLDALGFATFSGNVIHVSLPGAWVATLPATFGKWKLGATDAVSGEEKLLAMGAVQVKQ